MLHVESYLGTFPHAFFTIFGLNLLKSLVHYFSKVQRQMETPFGRSQEYSRFVSDLRFLPNMSCDFERNLI